MGSRLSEPRGTGRVLRIPHRPHQSPSDLRWLAHLQSSLQQVVPPQTLGWPPSSRDLQPPSLGLQRPSPPVQPIPPRRQLPRPRRRKSLPERQPMPPRARPPNLVPPNANRRAARTRSCAPPLCPSPRLPSLRGERPRYSGGSDPARAFAHEWRSVSPPTGADAYVDVYSMSSQGLAFEKRRPGVGRFGHDRRERQWTRDSRGRPRRCHEAGMRRDTPQYG